MRANAREAMLAGVPVLAAVLLALVSPLISLGLFIAIPIYFLYSTSRKEPARARSAEADEEKSPDAGATAP
jgi:type IV secretory pathway VirB3-like protein